MMLQAADREILREMHWMRALSPSAAGAIIDECRVKSVEPGTVLFKKGAKCDGLYGILSGELRSSTTTPSGEEIISYFIGPGEWFGETAAIDGNGVLFDTSAVTTTRAAMISLQSIQRVGATYPEFYQVLAHRLCVHVRRLAGLFELMVRLPPRQRLAYRVYELCRHGEGSFEVNLRQSELAESAGLSARSVTKLLNAWREEGLIETYHGGLRILDEERFKKLWVT